MIPDPRRATIRHAGPVWVLMAALVLSLGQTAAGDPADDEPVDEVPLPEPSPEISEATLYGWVFGEGTDRVVGSRQLDTLLRQKMAIVDQVCRLTDDQKRKLQLAGRGDAKKLFDRVDEIGAQIQLVQNDRDKVYELLKVAHSLQHDLIRPGFSVDGSLFVKSLEPILTVEQAVKFAPLRALVRAGGLVRIRRDGLLEALEISFSGSASIDDELAHLRELASLRFLILDKSHVTDAGLAHLAGLTGLGTLSLAHARVTDEGLRELQGLTELHELVLDDARVTDAGLAHLKGLAGLRYLSLKNTRVSDAGLVHLHRLTRLESLILDETDVTDDGLAHLKGLAGLQMLLLRGTRVTDSGIAGVQRALPRTAIHK